MDQPGTSSGKKRKSGGKPTLQEIALDFIKREGNKGICQIDDESDCCYTQNTCDIGNFIRHFRTRHTSAAKKYGLMKEADPSAKKPRTIPKRPIAIDKRLLLESMVKRPTYHNLPVMCVEWEGFKPIINAIAEAVGVTVNRTNFKSSLHSVAKQIKIALAQEMKNNLISLKVDSASRYNRHILGINVQYVLDTKVVIRTLGMVEIKQRQTAAFLKTKILDVLQSYGVSIDQIFSVTVDNGANMLAAVKSLKKEFDLLASQQWLTDADVLRDENLNVSLEIPNETDAETDAETDEKSQEITDALSIEFQDQLNLVRCSVHTLQLACLDVVNKKDDSVKGITAIAKKCKAVKFKIMFENQNAKYPPVWCPTRWGSIFKMVKTFGEQKEFFIKLGLQFPELELTAKNWEFIDQYVQAFKPLYICTKKLQNSHVSLCDFYMSWLMTISEVSRMYSNPYAQSLTKSLTERLAKLRTSQAFQMALYLDPRLNFLNSKLFATNDEKQYIQTCIKDTWNRICKLRPSSVSAAAMVGDADPDNCSQYDDFITNMYGGSLSKPDNDTEASFAQQLKALDAEPRQDHLYDVFKHWVKRRETHPELYKVAMVVLATPSNQVSVERAFSALALVLTSHRVGLGQETLEDILLIKLNKDIFQRLCEAMDWDDIGKNAI